MTRRYMRFDIVTPATVQVLPDNGDRATVLNLETKNISAGGAFFRTTSPLSGGTKVSTELSLSVENLNRILGNGQERCFHVNVYGIVMRSIPDGMAICFDEDYEIFSVQLVQGAG